ncbi:MAG: SGNH/GDSL hydrolase family protein [Cyanobacteria bacterium P01_G01_bin.54]
MQQNRSRALLKRLDTRFGWTSLGFLFALIVSELALRIVGFSQPILHQPEQLRGYAGRPNAAGVYSREGRAFVRMNRDGLRDYNHTIEKPPNTLRIAVLGDSYSEALQVTIDKTYWSVLQEELNEDCASLSQQGYQAEIVNFGVSGYGTAQQLLTLQNHVWRYDPDIVLLAFLPTNDIHDNSKDVGYTYRARLYNVPYFVYNEDGELVLDGDGKIEEGKALRLRIHALWPTKLAIHTINNSRILQLLYVFRLRLSSYLASVFKPQQVAEDNSQAVQRPVGLPDEVDLEYPAPVYSPPASPDWVEAWQITEDLLAQAIQDTHDNDAQFFLTVLTNPEAVNPDLSIREGVLKSYQAENFDYPGDRLESFAKKQDVDGFISLQKPFQAHTVKNPLCLHGFKNGVECSGHWNEMGHRLAGELVATEMCSVLTENLQSSLTKDHHR